MDKERVAMSVTKINCALELNRKVVGMKFLFNEDEFEEADAKEVTGKISYCVMVKSAMAGHEIKVNGKNFGCLGAARALGIIETEERFRSGQHYLKLGLYNDLTIAKAVRNKMTFCDHKAYGVMVKPLEEFNTEPDVVLIVTDSYNTMRIVQGYTHFLGINIAYKLCGNQAICSECTAYPFETNDMNISMLCGGTRYKASWTDGEIGIGIPFNKFSTIVDGIYNTINVMEPNDKKKKIELKIKENGLTNIEIEYDTSYYLLHNK